jgi:hypothetical protein
MAFGSSKVRSAHASILGVKPIPDDAFAESREAINKTSKFGKLFEKTVDAFTSRLRKLSGLNVDLIEALDELDVSDMQIPLRDMSHSVSDNKPQLDALKLHLHAFSEKAEATEEALTERDKKFWDKQHYESKISKLSDDKKIDNEFMERNVKKRSQSITAYAETEKTLRDAQLVAAALPDVVDSAVSMYGEYLTGVFSGFAQRVESRPNSPDTVIQPPPHLILLDPSEQLESIYPTLTSD